MTTTMPDLTSVVPTDVDSQSLKEICKKVYRRGVTSFFKTIEWRFVALAFITFPTLWIFTKDLTFALSASLTVEILKTIVFFVWYYFRG